MARKKLSMTKWNEIQRLKNLGHNKSEVARLLNLTRETVIKYWDKAAASELSAPHWAEQLDWKYIRTELNKKVPRKILYEEQNHSLKLPSYQAFCEYLRLHEELTPPEVTIKIHKRVCLLFWFNLGGKN